MVETLMHSPEHQRAVGRVVIDVVADAMDAARSSALAGVYPKQPSAEIRVLR
jgi:hypothetical protein